MRCAPLLAALLVPAALSAPANLQAQWTNRYPLLEGYSHHVYVEGFELPALDAGILDPAPSPDGESVAFSSRGWIWVMDTATRTARRVTRGGPVDARPAWSPDGRLAFVRDDTHRTWIVILDLESGREEAVIDDAGIVLDPAFSHDGAQLYYVSSAAGDLDLWRLDLASGERTRLTDHAGLELRPQPHPDGERVVYLYKTRGGADELRIRRLSDGDERTLVAGGIASQARPALSPDGRLIALNWPTADGRWELLLVEPERPEHPVRLALGLPLTPAWTADGRWIHFVEGDEGRNMGLRRIAAVGGEAEGVHVGSWEWGEPTGRLRIRTGVAGEAGDAPARLGVVDAAGHPALPDEGQAWFDGQNGRVFFYSPGVIEVTAPAGEVVVTGVQGLATPPESAAATIRAGETTEVTLELAPVWRPQHAGWYSGDHHFHLNYGGIHDLAPEDLVAMMRGEDLDVGTPLLANLHNRFEDQHLWNWRRDEVPMVRFGQEVRAHFHGHVGVVGTESLFWPWIWGPSNAVYNSDDRSNAEVLRHARREGGLASYVHPVFPRDPFAPDNLRSIPLELITDAVLGDLGGIELACLWTDELGTAEVWYRLLNLGRPVVPTAGTDVMTDYYRTMAVGTTRVYTRPEGPLTFDGYLAALLAGRSFVSTGPMLAFTVDGAGPGDVVGAGADAAWTLELYSSVAVEHVEILVNGRPVWRGDGLDGPGRRSYAGELSLGSGGWVAARAYGLEPVDWPVMNPTAFVHTSPVWIGRVGSTDPGAERDAARDLLRALDAAEQRLDAGYGDTPIPSVRERFRLARDELVRRTALPSTD